MRLPLIAVLVLAALLATACQEQDSNVTRTAPPATEAATTLPPGFTDEPPPAPVSDTLVLSGGTLVLKQPVADSVVVIQEGTLIAWGARGDVDMPNDSIGMDMRGKWLVPDGALTTGTPAAFAIYAEDPRAGAIDPSGAVSGSEVTLPES